MKEARVGTPIILGQITIIPLEEVSLHHDFSGGGLFVYASKEPIGIVVGSPEGKYAIDIHGQHVALEPYVQKIHKLQQLLDSL